MVHGRTLSIITDEVILTNLIANSWNFWNDSFKKTTKQDRSVMTSYALLLAFQRSNDRIWLMHAKQFRVKIANKEMHTHAANSCCFLGSCTCKLLQLHIYSSLGQMNSTKDKCLKLIRWKMMWMIMWAISHCITSSMSERKVRLKRIYNSFILLVSI